LNGQGDDGFAGGGGGGHRLMRARAEIKKKLTQRVFAPF